MYKSIAFLVICLWLYGCASQPKQIAKPPTPQPDTIQKQSLLDLVVINQAVALPGFWPTVANPDNDLWIHIRNGFAIPRQLGLSQKGHEAVTQWADYYAQRPQHINFVGQQAKPYLWHVVHAAEKRHMPLELAFLPMIESNYDPTARSFSGAGGLWQFMRPTAKDMGLARDWWHDGRFNVVDSTQAALSYLNWLHDFFNGDWLLAIAAYNAGPGRVQNALKKAQANNQPLDVWHLDLAPETHNYVAKFLAFRRLLAEPVRYGIVWPAIKNEPQTELVRLDHQIDLDVAADLLGMSQKRLQKLNPQIRQVSTSPNNPHPSLLVPADKAAAFKAQLAQLDSSQWVKRYTYKVRSGDNLSQIAKAFNLSTQIIRQANHMSTSNIRVGQRLAIPRADTKTDKPRLEHTVKPGESLWSIAKRYDTSVSKLRVWNRLDKDDIRPGQILAVNGDAPLPDFYQVKSGDTLWDIAKQFKVGVTTLRMLNQIGQNDPIHAGQRIRLQPTG